MTTKEQYKARESAKRFHKLDWITRSKLADMHIQKRVKQLKKERK